MKRLAVFGLVILLAMVTTVPALAHAALVNAKPGPGEVVPEPLTKIVLQFDGIITPLSRIQLIASDFQAEEGWSQSVERDTMTATLSDPLPPGTYTVVWSATSLDTHTTTGSYQFAVSASSHDPRPWGAWLAMAAGFLALAGGGLVWRRRSSAG